MKRKQRINELLSKKLKEFSIDVKDNSKLHAGHDKFDGNGETHMLVLLKKISKDKINRLEIHKKINNLLKEEFANGLHSLEINIK